MIGKLLMVVLIRIFSAIGSIFYHPKPPLRDRQATLTELIALSWLTQFVAKYGSDEYLDDLYDIWHFGYVR